MNDVRLDPILEQWLSDGPVKGPEHGLQRALAATRNARQQSRSEFPRAWLPMPVADVHVPRVLVLGFLLMLALLVSLALAVTFGGRLFNGPIALTPTEQVIAFSEGGSIYVANADGSNRRNLNVGIPDADTPVFSPDGNRIAFLGAGTLHIASVDRSTPRLVDASHGMVVMPGDIPNYTWSPDGARIAFSALDGGVGTIYVVDRDGGNLRAVTDRTQQSDLPSWGPVTPSGSYQGDWIAYRVTDPLRSQISLERVRPDGTSRELAAAVIGPDSNLGKPTWSPLEADAKPSAISYAMNPGFGTESRPVVDFGLGHMLELWRNGLGGFADAPIPWSPDSRYLAFINSGGSVMLADDDRSADMYDGQLRELGPVLDCWVAWSPDGQFLYGGAPNGCQGIVVVPIAAPSAAVTLSATAGSASWRPIP